MGIVFARVVFQDKDCVEKVLAAATGGLSTIGVLPLPAGKIRQKKKAHADSRGLAYRDPAELRKEIDSWMSTYDAAQEEKIRKAKEEVVDEDGFTKVVTGITRIEDNDGNMVAMRAAKRPSVKTGAFNESVSTTKLEGIGTTPYSGKKKKNKNKEKLDF